MLDVENNCECEEKPQHGPDDGEHEAFSKQLADETAAACAQSTTHGEFFASSGGAAQLQIGKIHANNQKDHADSVPKDNEGTVELAADVILEDRQIRREVVIPVRMNHFEMRKEAIRFIPGLHHGYARLETTDDGEGTSPTPPKIHDCRNEDIDLHPGSKDAAEIEAGGKHADNGDQLPIHCHRLADDWGAEENCLFQK